MSGSSSVLSDPEVQADLAWAQDWKGDEPWSIVYFKSADHQKEFLETAEDNARVEKLQNVAHELVHCEKSFFKTALLLKYVYQESLSKITTKGVCDRIFPNITELLEISRTFKNDMVNLRDPETLMYPEAGLYAALAKFLNQPNLKLEFTKWVTTLLDGAFIKDQMKNEKFAETVKTCDTVCAAKYKRNKGDKQDILGLIQFVMQRVSKLPMTIAELQKRTAKGTAEYDVITECLAKSKEICEFVNVAKGEKEDSRVEISARGWLINRRKSMSLKPGDCRMNYSAKLEDLNMAVNLVLYDQHLVLFPSDQSIINNVKKEEKDGDKTKGKSKPKPNPEVIVQSIDFESNNVYVSKSEDPAKFFIVSTSISSPPETKVYTISCELDNNGVSLPVTEAQENCEKIFRELNEACRAHTISKLEASNQLEASKKSIADLDTEILALLAAKLDIMKGQNMSTEVKDFTDSVTQLTFDSEALHKIAVELLGSYTGDDKDGKSAKVDASFKSVIANISGVTNAYQSGSSQEKKEGFFKKMRQSISVKPSKDKPKEKAKGSTSKHMISAPELQHTSSKQVEGAKVLQPLDEN